MPESTRTIVIDGDHLVRLPRLMYRTCPVCHGTGREFVHGWKFPRPCVGCRGQKFTADEPFDMVGAMLLDDTEKHS